MAGIAEIELAHSRGIAPWRATVAALSANLVGIGLARFGYTPLIPALIAAGWFTPAAAIYLGAANLAGYLAGALGARTIACRLGVSATLRFAMLLTAATLFACAYPLGFWWFFPWRLISGVTGGILMALAAPSVLPRIAPERRGVAGGVIFTGVGLGIAASGTLVPLLMRWGLAQTWFGLGGIALVLTFLAWHGWPQSEAVNREVPRGRATASSLALYALYMEYALNAVGLVPHMVFLVDFIARGLNQGLHAAAGYWVLFGIGALVGPLVGGHLGDRIGFGRTLRLAFAVQMICVVLPIATTSSVGLAISSFVVGAFVPGIVAITIGRVRELSPAEPAVQAASWGLCTTAFAIGQAIAGYGFSYIFAHSGSGYGPLFLLAAAALLLALAVDLAFAPRRSVLGAGA